MADYSKVNLAGLDDAAKGHGIEGMSFRGARDALGGERTGLSLQAIDPGVRQPFGHRHAEEEVYVILAGSGTLRVGDEEIAVAELDAVRLAPGAPRALEAGPDGLRFIAFGSPGSGGADAETMPGWWGD